MQPTASAAHSIAPVPCACIAVPTLSALCEVGCLLCSLPLPLAGCPIGASPSMLPKHKSGMADARAFGNCTPRLWDSDSTSPCWAWAAEARQSASHHLCPLASTALCQPWRGKDISWSCLMPFQLWVNAWIEILLNLLSALSWVLFLLRIPCSSGVIGNYFSLLL